MVSIFPFINLRELQLVAVKLFESSVEVEGIFLKQKHNGGAIIVKRFLAAFVKTFFKVFIRFKNFLQSQHFVLDAYSLLCFNGLIAETSNKAEPIKVDRVELVMQDLQILFMSEVIKVGVVIHYFGVDFTYYVLFFYLHNFGNCKIAVTATVAVPLLAAMQASYYIFVISSLNLNILITAIFSPFTI